MRRKKILHNKINSSKDSEMIDRKGCVGWSAHQLNCTVVSQRAHHDLCPGNFTSYELFSLKFPLQSSGLKDGTPDHSCLLKLAGDLETTCLPIRAEKECSGVRTSRARQLWGNGTATG